MQLEVRFPGEKINGMQADLHHKCQRQKMFTQRHPVEQIKDEGCQVDDTENQIEYPGIVVTEYEQEENKINK